MILKVGHVCGQCEKVLDEDDVALMGGTRMQCADCEIEVCRDCAFFCPSDDCMYWCVSYARKCKICKSVGIECEECF